MKTADTDVSIPHTAGIPGNGRGLAAPRTSFLILGLSLSKKMPHLVASTRPRLATVREVVGGGTVLLETQKQ